MSRIALSFANASCAHCARLVTNSLEKAAGVRGVQVDQAGLRLYVDFDPTRTTSDSIRNRLEKEGYPTRLLAASVPAAYEADLARAA